MGKSTINHYIYQPAIIFSGIFPATFHSPGHRFFQKYARPRSRKHSTVITCRWKGTKATHWKWFIIHITHVTHCNPIYHWRCSIYIYIIHNCIYIYLYLYIYIIIYSWGYDPFTTWDAPPGNLTKVDGDLDKGIN